MMTYMEKYYSTAAGTIDLNNNRFPKGRWSSSNNNNTSSGGGGGGVWDCGSTLYDSYELNSFKRQIDSAIANSPRTLSMPHLQEQRRRFSSQHQLSSSSSKSFKIPRPFQKLLHFVFNKSSNSSNNNNNKKPSIINSTLASSYYNNKSSSSNFEKGEKYSKGGLYVVYDNNSNSKSDQPVLSTIPELPEVEIMGGAALSPEITSFVKKSASERFPPTTSIGISCASLHFTSHKLN